MNDITADKLKQFGFREYKPVNSTQIGYLKNHVVNTKIGEIVQDSIIVWLNPLIVKTKGSQLFGVRTVDDLCNQWRFLTGEELINDTKS